MFRIADGREHFYQWDLDRQIIVEDESIVEVHFCNRTDDCSLVVEVIDGLAAVPNLILQKNFDVRVFGYDGKATRHDEVFKVKARSKPADYVYTETEVKNYDELAARIDEIERNGISEEIVTEAVENYLEKNPVDLTGYATEDYVDKAVKNVEVDLTGYATEDYVNKAIENIDIPESEKVDLTGYAKEQWVKDQGYLTEHQDLSSYATRTELNNVSNAIPTKVSQLTNDKNYLTKHQDISHLATIGQVQTVEGKIPTKTSQLTNDSGYLTQHQDLSGKADREHTHPSYALKTEIPSTEGLATEKYVDDAIDNIEIPEGESNIYFFNPNEIEWAEGTFDPTPAPDYLVEFAQKMFAGEKAVLYVAFDSTSGETRWTLSTTVVSTTSTTQKLIFSKGMSWYDIDKEVPVTQYYVYFSEYDGMWVIEDSTKFNRSVASVKYVDDAIAGIELPEGSNSKEVYYLDFSGVPGGLESAIAATPEMAEFAERYKAGENVCAYVNYGTVSTNSIQGYTPAVITRSVNTIKLTQPYLTPTIIESGNISTNYLTFYLKFKDNEWVQYGEITSTLALATKDYVDEAIAGIEIPESGGSSADLTNYYTKAETDQAIYNSKDAYYLDFSNATLENQPATEEMIEFATRFMEGENVCAYVQGNNAGLQGWQPITVKRGKTNVTLTTNAVDPVQIEAGTATHFYSYKIINHSTDGWVYVCSNSYNISIATTNYVDDAIQTALSGIATAEGGAY